MLSKNWDHHPDHWTFKRQSSTRGNMEKTPAPLGVPFGAQMVVWIVVAFAIVIATEIYSLIN